MPLTNTQVRQSKGAEKNYKLTDGGGLHLLITLKGGAVLAFTLQNT